MGVDEWLDAVVTGKPAVVREGLTAGIDPNVLRDGETPLCKAIEAGNLKVVRVLVEGGADVNLGDAFGMTSLHYAAIRAEKVDVVQVLLDAGANPRVRSTRKHTLWAGAEEGFTALEMARARRDPKKKIVALLESVS